MEIRAEANGCAYNLYTEAIELPLDPRGLPVRSRRELKTLFNNAFKNQPNSDSVATIRFGPYVSVRQLAGVHQCDRLIMLHERKRTNHLLYRFGHLTDSVARRRVFDRFLKTAHLDHAHILKVENVGYDDTGRLCVITSYPGNQEGLVTLGDLLEARGGRLEFSEAIRLMGQLLDSCVHASEQGIYHGPFTMNELLVDRHGCTLVELFGLQQALHNQYSVQDARSEQTRSIIEIGYLLATGAPYSDGVSIGEASPSSKLTKRNERLWDAWFALALDPVNGFETSLQAIDTMPTDAEQIARLAELKPITPVAPGKKATPVRKTGAVFARFRRSNEARKD
jgi:hypothetical protein|tara:strand:+ start:2367 stop:3380 length:1014 start_codon:yes stop_codon:yes gene_type:complete